jgi:DNA repair protein RadA/Sms
VKKKGRKGERGRKGEGEKGRRGEGEKGRKGDTVWQRTRNQ